jgi:hypothetical protein
MPKGNCDEQSKTLYGSLVANLLRIACAETAAHATTTNPRSHPVHDRWARGPHAISGRRQTEGNSKGYEPLGLPRRRSASFENPLRQKA